MTGPIPDLLAAASAAAVAATDMIEAARDGGISAVGNVGSGETVITLAESLFVLIDIIATDEDEPLNQLRGALAKFLEDGE